MFVEGSFKPSGVKSKGQFQMKYGKSKKASLIRAKVRKGHFQMKYNKSKKQGVVSNEGK